MPSKAGIGTRATGYAGPQYGPFKCGACTWFKSIAQFPNGACSHPEVLADKQVPKIKTTEGERAQVDAYGCCNEFKPLQAVIDVKFDDVIKAVP